MAAAKRYSAGAIFLQVVPVFKNVQRAIEAEAENIDRALGDRMEKSGDKAGQRAGRAASKSMNEELTKGSKQISEDMERELRKSVDGMNRALGDVNTRNLGKKLRGEVKGMRAELESLNDVDLKIDDNVDKVAAKVTALRAQIEDMRKRSKIFFDTDGLPGVYRAIAQVEAAVKGIDGTVKLEVDDRRIGQFERSMKRAMASASKAIGDGPNKDLRRLRDELDYLGKLRVGIDIGGERLRHEVREIMAELDQLSRTTADPQVRVDSGRSFAELALTEAALDRIDHRRATAHVRVEGAGRASRDADAASNSFRSFNIILLAVAGAGPALIPVLGAIAGGLLAIGPAAAVATAGLASILIGFSGIGDALTALQARDDQAGMQAGKTAKAYQDGARAQEDAARRVADARRAAAEAVEDALDRQRDAQEAYKDSIDDVREAEKALREARREAAGQGDDIGDRIKDNQLARDQGLLDVFNATVAYNSLLADGSATNAEKEQARINLEQSRRALEELREEQKELAKEKKKWDKDGVNGTEEVKSAQDDLTDAIDAQRDAYEDLQDAAEAVDEARADGARAVADAMRGQRDAARGVADALEGITAQQNNVDNAFDKLGPAGRRFALFLYALRGDFYAFRDDIQKVLLPAVQEAIEGFFASRSGSTLRKVMIDLAEGFGQFVKALSRSFQGPVWLKFFETLGRLGPDIQKAYGRAFIKFLEAMASLMTTAAPFALRFAEGLANMMTAFADWAKGKKGSEGLQRFMDYVKQVAPDVLKFIGALATALTATLIALAPYGDVVLGILTDLLDFITAMDPKTLGVIATGLLIVITASQMAFAMMNLINASVALFAGGVAGTIGLIALLLVGLGLAFAYLWKTNEDFRDGVKKVWKVVSEAVEKAWEDSIKPALEELWVALEDLWKDVLEPFFKWLGPVLLWLAEKLIPLLAKAWSLQIRLLAFQIKFILIPVIKAIAAVVKWLWHNIFKPSMKDIRLSWEKMVKAMKWAWEHVLKPVWNAVSKAAAWLWKKGIKPPIDSIKDGWGDLMGAMKWAWDRVLKPVFDFIVQKALPKLKSAFETAVDFIGRMWNGLKRLVGQPIEFIVNTVIRDGLIAGFNKVAGWVDNDLKIDFGGVNFQYAKGGVFGRREQAYATGGIMPGYTPGRDVHHFQSPTGGKLHLSGGEAIMRPEFTAAVGPRWVDMMNAAARAGGVNAIRGMFAGGGEQSYWLGGVIPLAGASVNPHSPGQYSGYASDMNVGGGYDDYGLPVRAWKSGIIAAMKYIGDASYGRWMDINHGSNYSRYAHLSAFANGLRVGQQVAQGTMIGRVGDLGNTGTPPTSHLHFEINGGTAGIDFNDKGPGKASKWGNNKRPPSWILDIVKNPLGYVKGLVSKPLDRFKDNFQNSDMIQSLTGVPGKLVSAVKDKIVDIMPGWVKKGAGIVGKGLDKVGDVVSGGDKPDESSWYRGGVYNGVMKYDSGGYLPPGLTTVVNLTGKPEPVFTNDQWDAMEGGQSGPGYHYEPHFEGSNLTPEDVAADMNFTFRRLKRGGKYSGVGKP